MERVDHDDSIQPQHHNQYVKPQIMPEVVTEMGTDPRMTERAMWEMLKRTENAKSVDDVNKVLQQPNVKYQPATDAELAQLLCYEAFEKDDKVRERLAREARELNPKSGMGIC